MFIKFQLIKAVKDRLSYGPKLSALILVLFISALPIDLAFAGKIEELVDWYRFNKRPDDLPSNIYTPPGKCYKSGDLLAPILTIKARPSDNEMLRLEPVNMQVSPWVDTGYYVMSEGIDVEGSNINVPVAGTVQGKWYPWGKNEIAEKPCRLKPCDPTLSDLCLNNGMTIEVGAGLTPCYVENGIGLYGLIAMEDKGGKYANPNLSAFVAENPPENEFRTFHIGEFANKNDFSVKSITYCQLDAEGKYVCNSGKAIPRGRLFIKILDSHYADNEGEYEVVIKGGVYKKNIISSLFNTIEEQLKTMNKFLASQLFSKMRNFIMVVLLGYILIFGGLFALGLLRAKTMEIVTALVKVGIIAVVIQGGAGYDFFNDYFFSTFKGVANGISDVIVSAGMLNVNEDRFNFDGKKQKEQPLQMTALPKGAGHLVLMDTMIEGIFSDVFSAKLWGAIISQKFFLGVALAICAFFIIMMLLNAIMLYIVATFRIALLIVVFPIFLLLLLFKMTSEFFQNWVKHMLVSSFLIVNTTIALALMLRMVFFRFSALLRYGVCEEYLIQEKNWPIIGKIGPFFKHPVITDLAEFDKALNIGSVCYMLLVAALFYRLITNIASLTDSLGALVLGTLSESYHAASGAASQGVNQAISIASLPVNLVNTADIPYVSTVARLPGTIIGGIGTIASVPEKAAEKVEEIVNPDHPPR